MKMNLVACLLPEYSIVFQGYCTECRHRVVDNVIVCANNIVFLSRPIQWIQTLTRYQWIESLLSLESKLFASWNVYLGQMRTSYSLAYFWLWYMHTIWTLSGIEYTM